ncbi:MAG: hypothetical protein KBA91_01295 [Candidatus Moranbacteria bacterium]|jgi:thiamine transporter ThiT|nr:hypothetical protein [Candidatus Moranbacteria bacterium]
MKNNLAEGAVVGVLVALLIVLVNPFDVFMPTMMQMLLVAVAGVLFLFFASFFWKEAAADEREELHRFLAARFAYLVGTGTLMLAVLVQSFAHALDPWVVAGLIGMLLAKVGGRLYAERNF